MHVAKHVRRQLPLAVIAAIAVCGVTAVPAGPRSSTNDVRLVSDNGLSVRPPMGFNTYNYFGENYDETVIKGIADAMVSSGMRDAGYEYVNLDGAWDSGRDANGNYVANATKFPSGIRALADYVHARGLKLGIYTTAGPNTCGSTRWPENDYTTREAQQFAVWQVDMVKVDGCFNADQQNYYRRYRDAIAATGRPMLLSINPAYNNTGYQNWTSPTVEELANMTRVTRDVTACWSCTYNDNPGVLGTFDAAADTQWISRQQPGHWIDPDMLEVGVVNGFTSAPGVAGLTLEENRAHFTMWAMLTAPLIVGLDVRSMSNDIRDVLTNPEVIAVDQDYTDRAQKIAESTPGLQVWSKRLAADGTHAVMLLNRTSDSADITVNWSALGLTGSASVRNLWTRTDVGSVNGSYTARVPSHAAVLLKVSGTSTDTNLLGNASVQYSSTLEEYGWGANRVKDGNRTGIGWTSYSNRQSDHTEWVQFTLPAAAPVNRVDLYPRSDSGQVGNGFPIDFTVQVSSEASCGSWSTVATRRGYGRPSAAIQRVSFPTVSARCLRVTGTKLRPNTGEGNTYYLQFAEVEAYGSGSPSGANVIGNPSFDAEGPTQTPTSWSTGGDADTSYTEAFGARDATLHGTHYRGTGNYAVYTYQTRSVPNGLYTVRAWVKGGAAGTTNQLEVKDYGGSQINLPINSSSWTQLVRQDINVTNGQATVGIYSVNPAGTGVYFDDVEFFKQ